MFIKYAFILFACILALMISIYKIFMQNNKRTEKTACYLSGLTWAFALYVLSAVILSIFISGNINKFVIILFALSPFIIGKLAAYKTENFYSIIQILCAVISAGYVFFV